MILEQEIIKRFCWEYPEFATVQPSLRMNIWCDILQNGKIIAESDLHGLPMDELGVKLPKEWHIVKDA